jgi:inhibitor of cysteine peptidase
MNPKPSIIVVVLMALLLSACSKSVKVGSSMNGETLTLEKGQTLVLKLNANPTTGYDWEIISLDPDILSQQGEVDYKADSTLTGSGGVDSWTFKAVDSGGTHLVLVYHRSWEKDTPPLETFELNIVVK